MNNKPMMNFSADDMKNILAEDTGFNNLLKSMPADQADILTKIVTDDSVLKNAMSLLPAPLQDQVNQLLHNIIHVPQEATRLYGEGHFFEARKLLRESIDLYQCPGQVPVFLEQPVHFVTKRVQALCYNLLGEVEGLLGNMEEAGRCHELSLQLAEETGDTDTIIKALQGLGVYCWERSDYEGALSFCQKALERTEGIADRWKSKQKILTTLSVLSDDIGQSGKAYDFALQAVDLCYNMDDRQTLPVCLNNLACLYMENADFDQAIEVLEAAREVACEQDDGRQEALVLCNLAFSLIRCSEDDAAMDEAEKYLKRALSLSEKIGSLSLRALATCNSGDLYVKSGQLNQARQAFVDAIRLYRKIGDRASEADALAHLGQLSKDDIGDIDGAYQALTRSIDLIEGIRGSLKRDMHRISYADQKMEPYALMVDCILKCHRTEEALQYVERSKSRALVDLLSARLIEKDVICTDAGELAETVKLLHEIGEIGKNLDALRRQDYGEGDFHKERSDDVAAQEVSQELLDTLAEREKAFYDAYEKLTVIHPDKADLLGVLPVKIADIHRHLDGETILIDFYQADDALRIFVVSRDEPVDCLTVAIGKDEAQEMVWNIVASLRQTAALDARSHDFIREVSNPLSECFARLFAPLQTWLERYRRIILAPHLFWHYLPFHALYDRPRKMFLCDLVEIGYSSSLSVLHLCLQKDRTSRDSALILSRNDGDLPHADREAEILKGVFAPAAVAFTGTDVHMGRISGQQTQYDVIHLACHGTFNQEQPFLSGISIPPEDAQTRPSYLPDLFRLNIPCTQITVSACESGLNLFTSADELIGLSRGFFYAGAASVMLSLWKVADESTCYLMENYYWHFAKNRQPKTRALQLAMQAVKARPEYAHPYYWAPFVIMGDWR